MSASVRRIGPQKGPQEQFLASPADIAIYGGAAGGGKTWALLMEPLRHINNPGFGAVFFRRNTVQIRNEGGLWDESTKIYPNLAAKPSEHVLTWKFPSGAAITFAHLEHDKTVNGYQGSQIPLICFDELTHFSASQFWYMLSRNRSMCGVRPYVRATCNPDPTSWVAEFISWWIDQETGLAIPERAGVIRWFVRIGDEVKWAYTPEELADYRMPGDDGEMQPIPPKSATFIPARLTDNLALMAADPGYMANLLALPTVERERLLNGNWKVRSTEALVFTNWSIQEFETPPDAVLRFGADWGFAVDPTVLIRCYIVGRRLYVDYEAHQVGCEITDTPSLFMTVPDAERWPITADSARPETIAHMRKNGFPKIQPAVKGKGSVEDGIEWLKSFEIVVHPRCANLIHELLTYSYKTDPLTGAVLPVLEDKNNHVIDALRYACEGARRAMASSGPRPVGTITPTRQPFARAI